MQQCNAWLTIGKIREAEAGAGVPDLVGIRGTLNWEDDPELGRNPRVAEFALLVALDLGAWEIAAVSGGIRTSTASAYRGRESLLE